jgi:DNA replication protein DnaC
MTELGQLSENVLLEMRDFIKSPVGFVLFSGKNGRGKTYVAKRVYHRLTNVLLPGRNDELAIFIKQADLNLKFDEVKEKYGQVGGLLKDFRDTKFLVVDDLGVKTPTPSFMEFLYSIFDYRWENQDFIGTMVTTHLAPEEFRKSFSDAILSRVASGKRYKFIGPDRRLLNDLG